MAEFAEAILQAGRMGVEIALFILLPIMVIMLAIMRLAEAWGILDRVIKYLAPVLKPFGLPGLGVFALMQNMLVSFAAPVATLTMMDKGGTPPRQIAATLALVLATSQANVTFPMTPVGLNSGVTMLIALLCGLVGAALTYHVFGRKLMDTEDHNPLKVEHPDAQTPKSALDVVNNAGKEAFNIAIGAIPMLVLALALVTIIRQFGVIDWLEGLAAPLLAEMDLPAGVVLPLITKYIAGGTAMMGVMFQSLEQGLVDIVSFNRMAGFLVHPFDLMAITVFMSSGPRVAKVIKPALLGAAVAIALRGVIHMLVF